MSFNYSILSYNKIEEIDEKEPIPTPTLYSSEEENEDKNIKYYYSFYLNSKYNIEGNKLNNNRSYSSPSLMLITKNNKEENKQNDSNEKINNILQLKNDNTKSNDLKEKKKANINPYKEKKIKPIKANNNNNYNNIKNSSKKKKDNKRQILINKSKSKSRNKKENETSLKNGDSTISNITIKNENTRHKIEFDNKSQNINVYINNNIFNFKISNKNQPVNETYHKNITVENKIKNYTMKKSIKLPKKDIEENNKNKAIQNFIFSNQNNKPYNVNNYNHNIHGNINHTNSHTNSNIKNNKKDSKNNIKNVKNDLNNKNKNNNAINNQNKSKLKNINISNILNNNIPVIINSNFTKNKNLKNIDNNTLSNNAITNKTVNNLFSFTNNKIINLKIKQLKRVFNKNGLFNILTFLDSKDINNIIETRNKKLILLINKSIFDAYHSTIKQNLEKYKDVLDILKYNLVYSKVRDLLRIDITISIRFINKNNQTKIINPKFFQLIYIYESLKTQKNNTNKLYDVYSFDLYCDVKKCKEKIINKEFKGIYLSKQITIFGIDKNDEIINIQPILPFKINDKGIFNLEIYSKNNFINPKNLVIKLKSKDLYKKIKELENKNIDNARINEYEYLCKYWKNAKYSDENKDKKIKEDVVKNLQAVKNIIKSWFEPYFIIKDIFYDNIGLSVYKFHLVAKECGMLMNNNLNTKIIVKENGDYIENEIKKNNLLFEKRGIFEVRKGENIIFYLTMNEIKV